LLPHLLDVRTKIGVLRIKNAGNPVLGESREGLLKRGSFEQPLARRLQFAAL
jgi:hypothetical protein